MIPHGLALDALCRRSPYAAVDALIETYEKAIGGINATLATEPAPADAAYDESKFVLSTEERAEFESLAKAHAARVDALRA